MEENPVILVGGLPASQLASVDLRSIVRRLPKETRSLLEKHPGDLFLAGGFIRAVIAGEPVSDIDLFVPHKSAADILCNELVASSGTRGVHKTANANTVLAKPPVQFIHRWTFAKPEDAINSFDFTIASAAIWYEGKEPGGKWCSVCHASFYADLASKRLIYTCPSRNEDAGGSMLRVLKFLGRGYRIPLDSIAAVMARLMMGVSLHAMTTRDGDWVPDAEPFLTRVLCGKLVEVDPNTVLGHPGILEDAAEKAAGDAPSTTAPAQQETGTRPELSSITPEVADAIIASVENHISEVISTVMDPKPPAKDTADATDGYGPSPGDPANDEPEVPGDH